VTFRGLGPLLRDLGADEVDTMQHCSVDVELEMPLALAYLLRPSYSLTMDHDEFGFSRIRTKSPDRLPVTCSKVTFDII
jgi:hypothetical protein